MRGAGPAVPKGAGAHPFIADSRASSFAERFGIASARSALQEGNLMNTSMRRMPRQRQVARGMPSGGNARQQYERYLVRAREAQLAGDVIEMENWYQHAEHYLRVMRGEGDDRRAHL